MSVGNLKLNLVLPKVLGTQNRSVFHTTISLDARKIGNTSVLSRVFLLKIQKKSLITSHSNNMSVFIGVYICWAKHSRLEPLAVPTL